MSKKIKMIFNTFCIFVILVLLIPNKVQALNINANSSNNLKNQLTPSKLESRKYSYLQYVIDKFDIEIVVNEDKTLNITENITAYFNKPGKEFVRTIPLRNEVIMNNETIYTNRVQILNLNVDKKYKSSSQNGKQVIKIGDTNKALIGEQNYTIKYTLNLGKDPIKSYDEIFYKIIAEGWDTVIGNITFTIKMPKKFDYSKFEITTREIDNSAYMYEKEESKLKYNVNGNTISGIYNDILDRREGLTLRCQLPEGYFTGVEYKNDIISKLMFILPVVFLLISILIWHKFGRDEKIIDTVEFYPPEGLNSLEVGYLYKGKADNRDVLSLFVYLANKGYIKIIETENNNGRGYKIKRLKKYDGNNENERIFLEELFKTNSHYSFQINKDDSVGEVTDKDLKLNFYSTVKKIVSRVNSKENNSKVFEKSAFTKKKFVFFMIIATYCIMTIKPIIEMEGAIAVTIGLISPIIGFSLLYFLAFKGNKKVYINDSISINEMFDRTLGAIVCLIFISIAWMGVVLPNILETPPYLYANILGAICIIGMFLCIKYLPKRTNNNNEIIGKIEGFKKFLETVEKDKIEVIEKEDPTYFYNIIPYAYVLGVSNSWIEKFQNIYLEEPTWYGSNGEFDNNILYSFIKDTMNDNEYKHNNQKDNI